MKVLITGGAGFIGSTVASAVADAGGEPVVVDDLSTGRREFTVGRTFYEGDIADGALLAQVFADHPDIDAVVHCAARIVVPESVADPVGYYTANVAKTLALVRSVLASRCRRLLFSSTAALYATGPDFTVDETSAFELLSPYATSKAMVERILRDTAGATPLRVLSCRYFNPVGADPGMRSGLQLLHPTHALGVLTAAWEAGRPFTVTGTDWPTRDGTGIRDYVHVWDLALGHVRALERFDDLVGDTTPYDVVNLGTGRGTTVRELVTAFEEATGARMPVTEVPRRPGDVAGSYARVEKAERLLGWRAERSIVEGITDSLAWRRQWRDRNP